MIGVVDYGMGNLRSVENALSFLGAEVVISASPSVLLEAERLVLPGVGSFRAAMDNIERLDLKRTLRRAVDGGRPLLGICLGMQLLADGGAEDGETEGFGWLPGQVRHFPFDDSHRLPVPHVGFNSVRFRPGEPLFESLGEESDFYFVHSYRFECAEPNDVIGWCEYGEPFAACVRRGHVFGTQFHPEKSQSNGLRLLRNFLALRC